MTRDHCLAPEACAAKGSGHCRRCAGHHTMQRHRSDPAFVARLNACARNLSSEGRASIARNIAQVINSDPAQQAARAERGRRLCAAFSADPAIIKARTEKMMRVRAAQLAERLRIPVAFVPAYRKLRHNKFTKEEAIGVLARSHPAEFRADQAARIAPQRRVIDWRHAAGSGEQA